MLGQTAIPGFVAPPNRILLPPCPAATTEYDKTDLQEQI